MLDIDKLDSLPLNKRKQLIKLIEEKGYEYNIFPLSSEQKRMWFLHKIDPQNPYYNSRIEVKLNGQLDEKILETTIVNIIMRHGILRTRYISIDGVPYQIIENNPKFHIDKKDLSGLSQNVQKEEFLNILKAETLKPFDLSRDLPIKAMLICFGNDTYSLIITMHHISLDGWSLGIFLNDFIKMLESQLSNTPCKLEPIKFDYVDYAMWQKKFLESQNVQKQLGYWKHTLRNSSHFLNLPTDFNRPSMPSYRGSAENTVIDSDTLEMLNQMATSTKTTLYNILLANFFLLIYRFSKQSNINIGTPVANRQKIEFENVFGFFANTVVINSDINDNMNFMQLLDQIKTASLNAFANQDIPFDLVVDALGVKREANFSPLFQAMFTLRNDSLIHDEIGKVYNLPSLSVSFNTLGTEFVEFVQFDVILSITQKSNCLEVSLGYNKDLFTEQRMKRFLSTYCILLNQVLADPNIKIKDYKLVIPCNEQQLVDNWDDKPIDNYSAKELLNKVQFSDKFEFIYKKPVNGGWISIIDSPSSQAPVGLEGDIIFSSDNSEWFYTGDRGYWKEYGELEITYMRHELIQVNEKNFSISEIEKNILSCSAVDECKIVLSKNNKNIVFIYYKSETDLDKVFFYQFFPSDLLNNIELFTYRVNYLPLTSDGFFDIYELETNIGKNLINIDVLSKQLKENPNVENVAAVSLQTQKELNKIPLNELYEINKSNYSSPERDIDTTSTDLCYAYLKGNKPKELPVKNLGELFKQTVKNYGSKFIRTIQYGHIESKISYKELDMQSSEIAQGLYNKGLKPNDMAILQINRLEDFLKVFWGCILGGIIPVPLGTPKSTVYAKGDAAVEKLARVCKHLNDPVIITGNTEFEGVSSIRNLYELDSLQIFKVDDLPCKLENDFQFYPSSEKDVALILFTSGSTGAPKGVQLTHRNIIKRSQATTDYNNLNADDISLNWMPLDHVGGIVMFHIRDVYGGIEQIHVETQQILSNPILWMDYVSKYNVTLTWAPNFAYGLIVQKEKDIANYDWDLSKLRFILNGGESINEKTSLDFMRILKQKGLPDSAMYPSWGMSETSSGVVFSRYFGKQNWNGFVEVGEPIDGVEIRIVDDEDNLKLQGEIGHFQIKGETITKGYYKNDEQNLACFTKDGWFKTGDLAVINNNQLIITGRSKDVIIINGINYHCQEIESAIEETRQVSLGCTASVGVRDDDSETEKLAIFYVKAEGVKTKNAEESIRESVLNKIGLSVDYIIELEENEVPRAALEKIQRSKLKELFEQGAFNSRLKKNARGVPQWFYEQVWKKAELPLTSDCELKGTFLIFNDENGLGSLLGNKLRENGKSVYFVSKGNQNEKINNTFYIDISKKESYEWLVKSLIADGVSISQIIHLWNYNQYDENELDYDGIASSQYNGVFSLMFLLQGMKSNNLLKERLKIYVVTSYAVYTENSDIVIPARSTLIGFIKSAALEIPNLNIRHIDFDCINPEKNAEQIILELKVLNSTMEIAYRNNQRLFPTLQKINMHIDDVNEDFKIKYNGTYVVTGGLGGIGYVICKYLQEKYGVKLIILGKTDLNTDFSENAERKKTRLAALKQKGIVEYASINIGEKGAFSSAVSRIENLLASKTDGILHLAGEGNLKYHWTVVDNHWITSENVSTFEMMYQPKVYGTKAVFDFAYERGQVDVIVFTSVNGIFGGSTFSAYSAANSFSNSEAFIRHNKVRNKNISWSIWDNIGMSEGNTPEAREVSKRMGYSMISSSDGLHSLEAIINRNYQHAIVGIDGSNNNFNSTFHSDDFVRDDQWHIYYSTIDKMPLDNIEEYLLPYDKENLNISLHHISEIPTNPNGEINYASLSQQLDTFSCVSKTLSETEEKLFNIWKEVLGHSQFGIDDKFFEVGGNSIKSIQVLAVINESFNIKIAIVDLFKYSSISELASFIDSIDKADTETTDTIGLMF